MSEHERYYGHNRAVVVTQDAVGFHERPMTDAERLAMEPAGKIADDIYRHANQAGVCYYELWEIIAKAIQAGIDASMALAEARADSWPDIRRLALEEAAQECVKWGDAHVSKWDKRGDEDMATHAKAAAWTALQCAAAIRAIKETA